MYKNKCYADLIQLEQIHIFFSFSFDHANLIQAACASPACRKNPLFQVLSLQLLCHRGEGAMFRKSDTYSMSHGFIFKWVKPRLHLICCSRLTCLALDAKSVTDFVRYVRLFFHSDHSQRGNELAKRLRYYSMVAASMSSCKKHFTYIVLAMMSMPRTVDLLVVLECTLGFPCAKEMEILRAIASITSDSGAR